MGSVQKEMEGAPPESVSSKLPLSRKQGQFRAVTDAAADMKLSALPAPGATPGTWRRGR